MPSAGLTQTALWDVRVNVGIEQSALWDVAEASTREACSAVAACDFFTRVNVDFMVIGTSRVTWDLKETFAGRQPWTFQLQVGATANQNADDWEDVGDPVVNSFVAFDPERRALGKQLITHYRVVLTDGDDNVYYSTPATVLGNLNMHDWLIAREHMRQERLRLKNFAGVEGYLLKKRRKGTPCTVCLDPYTGDVLNSTCQICKGTRYVSGYYRAIPCRYADMTNVTQDEDYSPGQAGWTMPSHNLVRATFVGEVALETGDIWVDATSDLRYFVNLESVLVRVRGVPVSVSAVLEQLEFHNIVYTIPLEGTP